jgi:hypothetical protein
MDISQARWRKSSLSYNNGCVEVAKVDGHVVVRDSKHRQGSVLVFTPLEWQSFLGGVRAGEFDLPNQHRPQI